MKTRIYPVTNLNLQELQNIRTREFCIELKVQPLKVDQKQYHFKIKGRVALVESIASECQDPPIGKIANILSKQVLKKSNQAPSKMYLLQALLPLASNAN